MTLFSRTAGLALCLLSCTVFSASVTADVLRVPAEFPNIQAAIDAAKHGDVVEIGPGIFTGPGNRDIRFNGKSITVRSAFGKYSCIVDAEGTSDAPFRGFIFDSGETTDAVLEGITIRGGATQQGAIADQFNGGGLFFLDSSATIKDCVIEGNECGCWGAGVYCSFGSSPVFINCDISNNYSNDDGGAVFVWNGGSATLVNCNLNNNRSRVTGGAVASFGGAGIITLINSTMANNDAPFGSAIFGSDVIVTNSIIWGNTGGDPVYQNWSTVNYSIVEGGYTGIGNIDANPLFVDAASGDYRLSPGSPGIDAADNTAIPTGVETDLFGRPRFVDDPQTADTGNGGAPIADLGPIELQIGTAVTADSVHATLGTLSDGTLSDTDDSDDEYLCYLRGNPFSPFFPHIVLEFEGTLSDDNPAELSVLIESHVTDSGIDQAIQMFNFETGVYEPVDMRSATMNSDSVAEFFLTGDVSRFVEAGTGSVKTKVTYKSDGTGFFLAWQACIDQFVWKVTD